MPDAEQIKKDADVIAGFDVRSGAKMPFIGGFVKLEVLDPVARKSFVSIGVNTYFAGEDELDRAAAGIAIFHAMREAVDDRLSGLLAKYGDDLKIDTPRRTRG